MYNQSSYSTGIMMFIQYLTHVIMNSN